MKLQRIQCTAFSRAQNVNVSPSYIIGCTGRRAILLDRQLNLVHTLEGFEYLYSAKVSPDEKHLLLISNTNKFHLVDLETFEQRRVSIRTPHTINLEGQGCWSFDGKTFLIIPGDGYSTLRRYQLENTNEYQDFLAEKYFLTGIQRLESKGIYFLTGINRQDNGRFYFIYFDGTSFQEYPVENARCFSYENNASVADDGTVTLYKKLSCIRYSADGKRLAEIPYSKLTEKAQHAAFGLRGIYKPDHITKYRPSSCGNYVYISSESGFYLVDAKTSELLAEVNEEYGVQNFEEAAPDVVALATWSGVKLYQVVDS